LIVQEEGGIQPDHPIGNLISKVNMYRIIKYTWIVVLQLTCLTIRAQQGSIQTRFNSYATRAVQEKLYLHTDKELYVSGDIMWFKIYYVEGTTLQPMDMSKLAYVEVISPNNEAVQQGKISLEKGTGKGSFYLPAALPTGNYVLRAYTNWMKNFDASLFFEKKITIVNTLKAPEGSPAKDSSTIIVDFFPEGGNLVNGLTSKIGFAVRNNKGSVNECRGIILNENNDSLVSFVPLKFGLGNFSFTPQEGQSYRALIILPDGSSVTRRMPQVLPSGYVMSVIETPDQKIKVTVKAKRPGAQENTEEIVLTAHKRQVLAIAEKAYLNDKDSAVFYLDREKLKKGISIITLFNGNGQPAAERLVFLAPPVGETLAVTPDQAVYGNRKPVKVDIGNAKPDLLDLSVAVYYTDNLQTGQSTNISDYMWLVSDLSGIVESPGYYFSNDPAVKEATENLLLTHGWRRFKWENVLQQDQTFLKYMPEINGHIVTGRVKDLRDDKSISGINNFLSIPGRPFGFYTSISDKDGIVYFETKNFYGNGQVVAQPDLGADSFYRTEIIKPYSETFSDNKYPVYQLSAESREQLLQRSIGMQVQNIYTGDSLRNFYDPVLPDTLPFFGRPENSYDLDDYKRFTTMEEVLREYVREVGVGIRGSKLIFKLFNPIAHDFYEGNSLVLLNGVPLPDPDKIFSYDPLKVKKIDVIRSRYVLGPSSFNGVTSFNTYDNSFAAFELEPRLVAIDYNGLQLEREFYSPDYSTREMTEKRIPDFRNTLYWAPSVHTGNGKAGIHFYSSDLPGKYTVVVQGMSEKGEFVSGTASFEVK
jgi:hypothetical protein